MDYKINTSQVITDYYNRTKNIDNLKKVGHSILKSSSSQNIIRGELAETLLVCMLNDYIEKNRLESEGWIISQGLIIKDLENPLSGKLTELDVTLFTPKCVYMFECKSYKGNKHIIGKGVLKVDNSNRSVDIFSQHLGHFRLLKKYLDTFKICKDNTQYKPYKLIGFIFSEGNTIDNREDKYKSVLPVINENNLYNIFRDYKKAPIQWDMKYINKLVNTLENTKDKYVDKHINYVKSKHS